jgi:hypothetical protein
VACLGTGFDVKDTPDLFEVVLGLLSSHFSVELEVGLGADQEDDCFFVSILSGFADPAFEVVEAFLAVDREGEENGTDALVEGAHDGSESFLTGLDKSLCTVSQIWSLT